MNVQPISFGKVIRVNGPKSTAQNILALANSDVTNKAHQSVQRDAKKLFSDRTKNGPVRVLTQNKGKDVFLLSGKESEIAANTIERARKDLGVAKIFMTNKEQFQTFLSKVTKQTNDELSHLITTRKAPFSIEVKEHRGQHRIHKVNIQK